MVWPEKEDGKRGSPEGVEAKLRAMKAKGKGRGKEAEQEPKSMSQLQRLLDIVFWVAMPMSMKKRNYVSGLRSRVDTDLGMEWGVQDTEALLSAMLNVSLLRQNPDCRDAWATKLRKQKPTLEFQFCSEKGKDG